MTIIVNKNIYKKPINFKDLSLSCPELREYLIPINNKNFEFTINFKDEDSIRCLTKCLLEKDFSLRVKLPLNNLIPTLPNRLDYINYIFDLSGYDAATNKKVNILDIGTGPLPVYPLLISRVYDNTVTYGTDIDRDSLELANINITKNNLNDKIKLYKTTKEESLIPPVIINNISENEINCQLCNPPFYESIEEIKHLENFKSTKPKSMNLGSLNEVVTEGGETAFVSNLIDESLNNQHLFKWYSSLLGKFSSLEVLINKLRQHNINNYALKEISLGSTRRWVLAWSFYYDRLPNHLMRIEGGSFKSLNPPSNEVYITTDKLLDYLINDVLINIQNLSIDSYNDNTIQLTLIGDETWSRSVRRKLMKGETLSVDSNKITKLRFNYDGMECSLKITWLYGSDRQLFISLYKHINSKLLN